MDAMPAPVTTPTPVRPRRRWLRGALLLLLAAVMVAVGAWLYFDYTTKSAWDAAEGELDRSDPRWRLLEIDADLPALADDENGALVIAGIAPTLDRSGLFYAAGKFEPAFEKLPPTARLNHLQMDLIKAEFAKLPEMPEVIRRITKLPHGRFVVKHTDDWLSRTMLAQQVSRQVVFWLKYEAYLAAEDKKFDEGLDKCRVILNVGRMVTPEFSLIEYLVRRNHQMNAVNTLERILAQGEPSPEALRITQTALAREITDTGLLHAVRAERAGMHHLMTNIRNGKVQLEVGFGQHSKLGIFGWIYDRYPSALMPHVPGALRHMTEAVEITKLPPHERKAELDKWQAKIMVSTNPVALTLTPALEKMHTADCTNQGLLRSAVVAVACERYRLASKTKDRWPATLEDLVQAKLLAAAPRDPIDNQPLRYRKTKGGVVIYSIGADGVDNLGHLDHSSLIAKGVDVGFRLWDAEARRQPALPPLMEKEEDR